MNLYLVSVDGDDCPDEPVMAADPAQAANLYVQAVLAGRAVIGAHHLQRSPCVWISQFVIPEGGVGLMRDTLSTSIPIATIPSWQARNDAASDGPGGPV